MSATSIPLAKSLLGFPRPALHQFLARFSPAWSWCLLAIVGIGLFTYGLPAGDLWRTEGLRAQVAQEMLTGGDWIVPRLYGEPLFTKPPGMYLAILFCSLPFGQVTEWSARLPSALAATACMFLFAWYFGRRLGRTAGLVAGLMLPMSMMWLDKATAAEIDMLQTAWITAAILFFFRAVEDDDCRPGDKETGRQGDHGQSSGSLSPCLPVSRSPGLPVSLSPCPPPAPRNTHWWLAALLCVAGGVLTKWTAPEFFYGTAIPYLWWKGKLRLLLRWPHLLSAAIAALICLAWFAAAAARGGWDNLVGTVLWEGLSRLLPGYNTYRPYPWLESLYHPFKLLLNTLPWSALALLALRPSFFRLCTGRERDLLVGLHCWVWPQMLFWSLPSEHTPRHSFPLFPGLTGLAVMVWHAWDQGRLPWRMPRWQPRRLLLASLAVWFAVKAVHVEFIIPARTLERQSRNKAAILAALVPESVVLYLCQLKDEGLMFYYGRPALHRTLPDQLPVGAGPAWCILTEREWRDWNATRRAELVQRLPDSQGAPIFLVRVF